MAFQRLLSLLNVSSEQTSVTEHQWPFDRLPRILQSEKHKNIGIQAIKTVAAIFLVKYKADDI